jgi:hypothetical protein
MDFSFFLVNAPHEFGKFFYISVFICFMHNNLGKPIYHVANISAILVLASIHCLVSVEDFPSSWCDE